MAKSDLSSVVRDLASAATAAREASDRGVRAAVREVIDGFADARTPDRPALRLLGKVAAEAEGQAAQILFLTLGAVVEGGAPPEAAWPAIESGLGDLLKRAARFAHACIKHAEAEDLESAFAEAATTVARKRPLDAAAWNALPSRCLAAVACLTRSRSLRKRVRAERTLRRAAEPLTEAVAEVGFFAQVADMLDDEPIVVLHPATGRGFRVVTRDVASNLELGLLLADALIGDPKQGLLRGRRPSPKAMAALRNEAPPKGRAPNATPAFDLLPWTELSAEGSLPVLDEHTHDHGLDLEASPAIIPPLGGHRVVILRDAVHAHSIPIEATFVALRPELRVAARLKPAEVETMLASIQKRARRAAAKATSTRRG
jgi:hypothetical protein